MRQKALRAGIEVAVASMLTLGCQELAFIERNHAGNERNIVPGADVAFVIASEEATFDIASQLMNFPAYRMDDLCNEIARRDIRADLLVIQEQPRGRTLQYFDPGQRRDARGPCGRDRRGAFHDASRSEVGEESRGIVAGNLSIDIGTPPELDGRREYGSRLQWALKTPIDVEPLRHDGVVE